MTQAATQQATNEVAVRWLQGDEGGLDVNGKHVHLFKHATGKLLKDARPQRWWTVQVANDWNMSNRFLVQAASIDVLVEKLESHPHRLVSGRGY